MFFDEKFIKEVEESPTTGIMDACKKTLEKFKELSDSDGTSEAKHELLWESASFISIVNDVNDLGFNARVVPTPTENIEHNCKLLLVYIRAVAEHFKSLHTRQLTMLRIQKYQKRYETALKGVFCYEFSKGDLDRVQVLVNEIREMISENDVLDDGHKRRLLIRLEKLQSELHKKVSDLDRFWGMVGDAGVVLGKLGTDAKPIVDRVREMTKIVWNTQSRAEELPSDLPNPMIEHDVSA